MRTIAIVNQKGGCGKTTTAINLSALYAARGLRTLLIDMDPQSHCAVGLGVPEKRIEYSIGDALLADHSKGFEPATLVWEVARNLHLAPSTVLLSALEAPGGGLHQLADKDRRLESLLNCVGHRYDRCLIDCPPTIGLLTFNAMRAAREALIPVETGFFSLRGAERQWATIQRLISHIGRPIACHLLPTLHNPDSQLACNILAALRRQFAGQILPTVIHEHEVLREAASFGQPVLEYAPNSKARADFEALADWLEEHAARPSVDIEVVGERGQGMLGGPPSSAQALLNGQSPNSGGPLSGASDGGAIAAPGSRAAELARRMHGLAARAAPRDETPPAQSSALASAASDARAATLAPAKDQPLAGLELSTAAPANCVLSIAAPADELSASDQSKRAPADFTHLYGVRHTSGGVLFVHPGRAAQSVSIAGDFNFWSPSANPMRFNDQACVFETIVKLAPGSYQYRLVVDGRWVADPYNERHQLNSYGEPNSVVTVAELPVNPQETAPANAQVVA